MAASKKTVLVTNDLSEESFRDFPAANELARSLGGRIVLLYVLPTLDHHPTGAPFVSPVPLPTDAELKAQALRDMEGLRSRFTVDDLRFEVRSGESVDETVCQVAAADKADYIVVATHGRSGLSRMVMGSIAESILRRAHVPVLVVPLR